LSAKFTILAGFKGASLKCGPPDFNPQSKTVPAHLLWFTNCTSLVTKLTVKVMYWH